LQGRQIRQQLLLDGRIGGHAEGELSLGSYQAAGTLFLIYSPLSCFSRPSSWPGAAYALKELLKRIWDALKEMEDWFK